MHVATRIPASSSGGLAWWVKCCLDGFALGAAPMWRSWRLPYLYQSGVVFQFEPAHGSGYEDFTSPPDLFARGFGDCDDLVYARLCELLAGTLPDSFYRASEAQQVKALVRMRAKMGAGKLPACHAEWAGEQLHVRVRMPNGKLEDPAEILGAPKQ